MYYDNQIVEIAKKRNSGARALRAVMEECLMGLMYKVPDNPQIDKKTITGEFILGNTAPVMTKNINIAVIGLGNIGSFFCNEIKKKRGDIFLKTGKKLNLLYVSARHKNKKRLFKFKNNQWIKNPLIITKNPSIHIVVELIGGSDGMAKKIAFSSLINKKHFITANKSLIA